MLERKITKVLLNWKAEKNKPCLLVNGTCTAVEVKSGNNKQAKSLKSIVENYKTVNRYIKLENHINIYVDDKGIEHYPIFMIMFL